MKTNQQLYDRLCDPVLLEDAWIDACDFAPAAGVPRFILIHYERFLALNLEDLAARLRDGSYSPAVTNDPENSGTPEAAQRQLEDLIVQQALRGLLARQFALRGCANRFSDEETEGAERAVARVLAQRAAGASIFIGAELACQPSAFAPELMLPLLMRRSADRRLHHLLRLLLNRERNAAGSFEDANEPRPFNSPSVQTSMALSRWEAALDDSQQIARLRQTAAGMGRRQGAEDEPTFALRPLVKAVLKQFGRDVLTTALGASTLTWTAGLRPRRLFTKKSLIATGALLLVKAAFPAVMQMFRKKPPAPAEGADDWPDQPLSLLFVNLALQEFDAAMLRAGLPLIRCGNRLALTARSGRVAHPALQYISQELRKSGLSLQPGKTFIRRFDQGVEFFGYRFHEDLIAATPQPLPLPVSCFADFGGFRSR